MLSVCPVSCERFHGGDRSGSETCRSLTLLKRKRAFRARSGDRDPTFAAFGQYPLHFLPARRRLARPSGPLVLWSARRENGCVAKNRNKQRPDIVQEHPKQHWHKLLDDLTKVRAGDSVTIELLDAEFGDELEAERMPLAYLEYDERDGRYPVVLRHSIEHPTSIRTDSKPPMLPLAVQIVAADGSETLVTVLPLVEER